MNEKKEALKNEQQHKANEQFKTHVQNKRWDDAQALFSEDNLCQPDSDTINSIFKTIAHPYLRKTNAYHFQKTKKIAKFLCNLQDNNKLTQDTVSLVFENACANQQWELVKLLGDMDGDNKPNQNDIDFATDLLWIQSEDIRLLKILCNLKSDNKPRQEILDEFLLQEAKRQEEDSVSILCRSNLNRPSQGAVNKALKIIAKEWELKWHFHLLVHLCGMQTDNKPNQEAIEDVLDKAAITSNKEIMNVVCSMNTDNKPSQKALNAALFKGIKNAVLTNQWGAIEALCNIQNINKADTATIACARELIKKYKPQTEINELFRQYTKSQQWDKAEKLLMSATETLPNKNIISSALIHGIFTAPVSLIKILCTLDAKHRPNEAAIVCAFELLLGADDPLPPDGLIITQRNQVGALCALEGEHQLSSKVIKTALQQALDAKNWEIVKYFCQLTSENKPNQNSIRRILRSGAAFENMELLKTICTIETDNKPTSQILSEALLNACDSHQWNAVEYLCDLKTENKPNEITIDHAQKEHKKQKNTEATHTQQEEAKPTHKQPEDTEAPCTQQKNAEATRPQPEDNEKKEALKNGQQDEVNKQFQTHVQNQKWKQAQDLFSEHSPCPPDGNTINSIFKTITNPYHFSKNGYSFKKTERILRFLCNLKGNNKLTQEMVSVVFKNACDEREWKLVKLLGDMDGENKPDQEAISYATEVLLSETQVEPLLKILCNLKSANKPSQEVLDELLLQKVKRKEGDSVSILCRSNLNRPSQGAVNKALKIIANGQWDLNSKLLIKLCQMQTDNKPNQEVINDALEKAAITSNTELMNVLCSMSADNRPSQKALNAALFKGIKNAVFTNQWGAIEALCNTQNTNKADAATIACARELIKKYNPQTEINQLFKQYIEDQQWDKAKELLGSATGTLPNKNIISMTLVHNILRAPASLIKALCTLDAKHRPNQAAIVRAFKDLVIFPLIEWEKIKIFCTLEGEHQLSSKVIKIFLQHALDAKSWEVVKYFCRLTSENKPNQNSIRRILRSGAAFENMELLKTMCTIETENQPTSQMLSEALLKACDSYQWEAVKYLCDLKTKNKPNEITIKHARIEYARVAQKQQNNAEVIIRKQREDAEAARKQQEDADTARNQQVDVETTPKQQREAQATRNQQVEAGTARNQQVDVETTPKQQREAQATRNQQEEQLKEFLKKTNKILTTLENKIKKLEKENQYNVPEAKEAARSLLEKLKKAREVYQKTACSESNAQQTFNEACFKAIDEARPILEKDDLSWRAYLTNIFKALLNAFIWAMTLGNRPSFFAYSSSESSAIVKEAGNVNIAMGNNARK